MINPSVFLHSYSIEVITAPDLKRYGLNKSTNKNNPTLDNPSNPKKCIVNNNPNNSNNPVSPNKLITDNFNNPNNSNSLKVHCIILVSKTTEMQ